MTLWVLDTDHLSLLERGNPKIQNRLRRMDANSVIVLEGQSTMPKNSSIISVSPDVMGGTPVFAGTRVPVQTLLEYLKAGESIGDFLAGFPTVTQEQVVTFIEEAGQQFIRTAA